jgi:hypothetical protein
LKEILKFTVLQLDGHAFTLGVSRYKIMKISEANWKTYAGISVGIFLAAATVLTALSQSAPVLSITSLGTNQVSLTITNANPADSYELWWTPVLGNTATYPWSAAAVGNIGQSNFILNMNGLQTGFFYGVLDTNAVPLWEEANPGTPGSPILQVNIISPANGSTLN